VRKSLRRRIRRDSKEKYDCTGPRLRRRRAQRRVRSVDDTGTHLYSGNVQSSQARVRGMKEVNVTELRQNLPAYLARVQRGERINVTSRGKVIALLAPPVASADRIAAARARLRGSVTRYDKPLDPVIEPDDWDVNR